MKNALGGAREERRPLLGRAGGVSDQRIARVSRRRLSNRSMRTCCGCLDCFSIKKAFRSGRGSKIRFMRRAPIPDMERSPSRPFVNTWTRKNGRKRKARSPRSRKSSKRWLAASTKRRKISRMRSHREQSEAMPRIQLFIAAALIASGSQAAAVAPVPPPPPPGPVVILTGRALDGAGAVLHGARIGIANGKISTLTAPTMVPVIDLRGYTVLPGWIDTHVHLRAALRQRGTHRDGEGSAGRGSHSAGGCGMADADGGFHHHTKRRRSQQCSVARCDPRSWFSRPAPAYLAGADRRPSREDA